MSLLSRRALARLTLRLAALWATGAAARSGADRGPGGAGAAPTDPEETIGQDRGIGGTGVVGTIRQFGSIVVNDLRVSYPADVRVTIDGARATIADLRIGQVVRVLARTQGDGQGSGLGTRAIYVTNEVVGPVDAIDEAGLTVLGQRILAEPDVRGSLGRGQTVAIGGLRRLDGAIDASVIEPRPAGTPARLAGPLWSAPGGSLRIGDLDVIGVKRSLLGRRVVLSGRRVGAVFRASVVAIEPADAVDDADRLSIEGYLTRDGNTIRFGSGVTLASGTVGAQLDDDGDVMAIVTATVDERGIATATDIHFQDRARHGIRGIGLRAPGPIGSPGTLGQQRGSARGSPAAGSNGPGRGGRGGGNR